jgi:four helix bundle protein
MPDPTTKPRTVDHEKLNVYQEAIRFASWSDGVIKDIPKSLAVRSQLERASTSIALNIAEGNGKFTPRDRWKFFDTARGSALECAACLDLLIAKKRLPEHVAAEGKAALARIVAMLVGLIKTTSPDRIHESPAEYGCKGSECG